MYDHNIKAGNQGDVIKHIALIATASVLMEQNGSIFHYADTFAGYAYNPLKYYGEWPSGIGALYDSGITSQYPANVRNEDYLLFLLVGKAREIHGAVD